MRWWFRRRLLSAHTYLDAAAGILQNRGKCEGRSIDDWGRVDAIGAIRCAVWGAPDWDVMMRLNGRRSGPVVWEKYDETKMLLFQYIIDNVPEYAERGRDKSWLNSTLQKWSDETPQEKVVATMRQAAWKAEVAAATWSV